MKYIAIIQTVQTFQVEFEAESDELADTAVVSAKLEQLRAEGQKPTLLTSNAELVEIISAKDLDALAAEGIVEVTSA